MRRMNPKNPKSIRAIMEFYKGEYHEKSIQNEPSKEQATLLKKRGPDPLL